MEAGSLDVENIEYGKLGGRLDSCGSGLYGIRLEVGRTVGSHGSRESATLRGWLSGLRGNMNGRVGMEGWGEWNGEGISGHRDK